MNRFDSAITSSPNAQDLGTIDPTDPNALPRMAKSNPAAMDAFLGKSNMVLQTLPTPDGKFHLVMTDRAWADQKNTEPMEMFYPVTKDGKLTAASYTVPPLSAKVQDIINTNLSTSTKIATANKAQADADRAAAGPAEKSPTVASLAVTAASDPDPQKRANAKRALDFAKEKAGTGTSAGTEEPGFNAGAANIVAQGGTTDQALAAIPIADRGTVKAIGEGRMAPPSRFTKDGKILMNQVNSVYPDYDATKFKTYQTARTAFTSGTEGIGLNFIQTARNHLDRMEKNIPDNVTIPWGIGTLYNSVKNSANRSTSPTLKAFEDDLNAVTAEVARAYTGKALTDPEHDKMMSLLSESDSPGALRGAIGEFRNLLNGKLQSYRTQWDSSMPSGVVSPNGTLEALERGQRPTPPASNAPPASALKEGIVTHFGNGQSWTLQNGQPVRTQ
jgi:hypothetical protein